MPACRVRAAPLSNKCTLFGLIYLMVFLGPLVGLMAEEKETITVQAPVRSMEQDDVEGGTSQKLDLTDVQNRTRELAEILEREASIRVQRYGGAGAYSTLSIRGSNANQVNVYINGIPLNNAVTGEVNLADLDVGSMDSIEIHRGTAMMLSNPTIGGAVNLKTADRSCGNRIYLRGGSFRTFGAGFRISDTRNWDTGSLCRKDPGLQETQRDPRLPAELDGQAGRGEESDEGSQPAPWWKKTPKYNPRAPSGSKPNDYWYSLAGGGEVSDQDFLFRNENGTPVLNTFDDFDDRRKNAQYRKASLTATAGFFQWKTRFDILNDFFYREHGVPGPGSDQTEKTKRKHLRNTTGITTDTRAAGWSRLRFKSRLYYTEVRNHFFDEKQEFSFQFPGSKSRLQQTGLHLMPEIHLPEYYQTLKFLFGHQREIYHEDERNALDEKVEKNPTKFRNQSSIHVVDEFSFFQDALQIHPFLRYERYVDRFNEPVTLQDPLKESAITREFLDPGIRIRGRIYRSDSVQIHLRGAAYRSRRVPLFVELFGESGSIVSNADLKAEDAETFEAGADVNYAGRILEYTGLVEMQASLTVFQRNVKDMIIFVPNSRFSLRAENVDGARIQGIETGAKASWKWLEIHATYTYQEAINTGDVSFAKGKYLPLRPLHDFSGGFALELGDFRPGLETSYTGAVFQDRSNDFFFYQEPRWLHTAFLGYSILDSKDHALDFYIEVRNLLNDRAEDIVGYPIPGRSVYASLSYRF